MNHFRILVIEDSPDERQLVDEAFAATGHDLEVASVGSAGEALAFLEPLEGQRWPHLLVTDLHLPDHSGQELIGRLRQRPAASGTAMVLLSGDVSRPQGLVDIMWYGKPDTWAGWCSWAEEMVKRHLISAAEDRTG
jgi:CheY-like chemotaxis protein